jgi:hypothetical protein
MKKIIWLILIVIPQIAFSQRFQGGVLLGFNASQIDGDDLWGYNKAGLMGGVFVFTEFTNKWKGQMEIKYSAKGSATPKGTADQYKIRLQYIEMPIVVEYGMFKKVQLQAGGTLGYLFNAGYYEGFGYAKFKKEEMPYSLETAICVGLNATFIDPIIFNVRFSYSLFPIREKYTNATYYDGAWYNNLITFGIYYRIGKRRYN